MEISCLMFKDPDSILKDILNCHEMTFDPFKRNSIEIRNSNYYLRSCLLLSCNDNNPLN